MNAAFGLDHPLIATHDIEALRDLLIAMGFTMTPIGRHPWGTSTSLAMFEGCLLEIMGIYNAGLIDEVPAGDFRFGRHVYEHLQQREGIALTALHSTNSQADAVTAAQAGFNVAGHLEFSRKVTLPDGTVDHTKTTLALLPDSDFPRLSFFLCQQHRPELIYVPEWLAHPNSVHGLCGVNIVAQACDHATLVDRFSGLYGAPIQDSASATFTTANGRLRIFTRSAFERDFGALPQAVAEETQPFIAGMDFRARDLNRLADFLTKAGVRFRTSEHGLSLAAPQFTANTKFRFFAAC